ncbi:hypothetical protein BH11BAC2_BH11BAC2_11480 [soil metagenome]
MKPFLYIFLFSLLFSTSKAQQFEWVRTDSFAYSFNPSIGNYSIAIDAANHSITSRMDSLHIIFGNWIMGDQRIEKRDELGNLIWDLSLVGTSSTQRICTDASGNIYIAGNFLETFHIGANDSLVNTGISTLNINLFIISLDPNGQLRWKKNASLSYPDPQNIEAITCDHQGNFWYAVSDFFSANITKTDANGIDMNTHTLTDAKRIGEISFDPWDNLFIGGSAQQGIFTIDDSTYQVTDFYNFFLARIASDGTPSWAKFSHDVTFQAPIIKTDGFGNVYMAAFLLDTCSFGNIQFTPLSWGSSFYIIKADSVGNFSWGYSLPLQTPNITGDFSGGNNVFIDCDSQGNLYIGGNQQGTLDWGNSVVNTAGAITDSRFSITSFDSNGTPLWNLLGGGDVYCYLNSIALDHQDNLYFVGSTSGNCTFGNINFTLPSWSNFTLGKINLNALTGLPGAANSNDFGFNLYPNPSQGEFMIPVQMQGAQLEIYNQIGQQVYLNNQVQTGMINTENLSSGLYVVKFMKDGNTGTFKWIKTEDK